jgi:cadmium resistance protein CadD (predicted permease)
LTPWKIAIGQAVGFTIIVAVSMIGFGVALVLPSEPIGFLGLLPIMLGVWKGYDLVIPPKEEDDANLAGMKSILIVALITLMNGGDNIGVYVPLFSQTKGPEIAVYVVVFYILLAVWLLAAWLILRQRHILKVFQKYAHSAIPLLYVGLGVYIVIKSSCYPWSIDQIDDSLSSHLGKIILGICTSFFLLICMGVMLSVKLRRKASGTTSENGIMMEEIPAPIEGAVNGSPLSARASNSSDRAQQPHDEC